MPSPFTTDRPIAPARPRPPSGDPAPCVDPAEPELTEIVCRYPRAGRRHDLLAVEELRRSLAPHVGPPCIVVVGTNGKSSTATYVSRLLTAAGLRTGLYTSPHLIRWTERLLIDGTPCDTEELLSALHRSDAAARRQTRDRFQSLRFFDVLTLAAEQIFADHAVDVSVFEAGIGGRLDATQVLHPEVVALCSVGHDHHELLGDTLEQILLEKLEVASDGADLITPRLSTGLRRTEHSWAERRGVQLTEVDGHACEQLPLPDNVPAFQRRNLALAVTTATLAVERFHLSLDPAALPALAAHIDTRIRGRFDTGAVAAVRYVADTAHNTTAWSELVQRLEQHDRRFVAVVAVTAERDLTDVVSALVHSHAIAGVIATSTRVRGGPAPVELQGLLNCRAAALSTAESPEQAFATALERAASDDLDVLVTGSSYLVADFLVWAGRGRSES